MRACVTAIMWMTRVEAAVAAAVEAVARRLARADRQRRGADVHGEGGLAREARGAGHLADELRRAERRAAGQREQLGGEHAHERADLALQGAHLAGELAAARDQLEGDARARASAQAAQAPPRRGRATRSGRAPAAAARGRARGRAGASAGASGCACARRRGRRGGRRAGARRARARRGGPRAESGSRSAARATHSASIGSDLPWVRAEARAGHQLGRHAHEALAARQQVALEAAGDVAAVLDGEEALAAEAARPGEQLVAAGGVAAHRRLGEAAPARGVDGHGGVGLHVRVDPDYDHVSPPWSAATDASGDRRRTRLGWGLLARLLSGHVGDPSASGGGGRKKLTVSPRGRQMRFGSLRRRSRGYLRLLRNPTREE